MSSGVKDEAAARQLGISDRTYRRHVADILLRLGAPAGSRPAWRRSAAVAVILAPGSGLAVPRSSGR